MKTMLRWLGYTGLAPAIAVIHDRYLELLAT